VSVCHHAQVTEVQCLLCRHIGRQDDPRATSWDCACGGGHVLRRCATKPQSAEYGAAEMRDWYRDLDLLPGVAEYVIPADLSLDQTVHRIMTDAGLGPGRVGV
jgi:hypothetical protein